MRGSPLKMGLNANNNLETSRINQSYNNNNKTANIDDQTNNNIIINEGFNKNNIQGKFNNNMNSI